MTREAKRCGEGVGSTLSGGGEEAVVDGGGIGMVTAEGIGGGMGIVAGVKGGEN